MTNELLGWPGRSASVPFYLVAGWMQEKGLFLANQSIEWSMAEAVC